MGTMIELDADDIYIRCPFKHSNGQCYGPVGWYHTGLLAAGPNHVDIQTAIEYIVSQLTRVQLQLGWESQ